MKKVSNIKEMWNWDFASPWRPPILSLLHGCKMAKATMHVTKCEREDAREWVELNVWDEQWGKRWVIEMSMQLRITRQMICRGCFKVKKLTGILEIIPVGDTGIIHKMTLYQTFTHITNARSHIQSWCINVLQTRHSHVHIHSIWAQFAAWVFLTQFRRPSNAVGVIDQTSTEWVTDKWHGQIEQSVDEWTEVNTETKPHL